MAQALAVILVLAVGIYAAIGLLFAVCFAVWGAGRIDPAAHEGTWGFRLLIVPGALAFWPLLARRWRSGVDRPPVERNPHRDATREMR